MNSHAEQSESRADRRRARRSCSAYQEGACGARGASSGWSPVGLRARQKPSLALQTRWLPEACCEDVQGSTSGLGARERPNLDARAVLAIRGGATSARPRRPSPPLDAQPLSWVEADPPGPQNGSARTHRPRASPEKIEETGESGLVRIVQKAGTRNQTSTWAMAPSTQAPSITPQASLNDDEGRLAEFSDSPKSRSDRMA